MKKSSTIFLQIVIVLIAIAAAVFLIWEPTGEGVNVNKTLVEIYFKDPFLAYAYVASITFFTVLYQAFRILGRAGKNLTFSQPTIKSLRIMKYAALLMIPFVIGGVIIILSSPSDDRPPILGMGTLMVIVSITIAAAAAMFEKILKNGMDIKSENDLTV